MFLPYQAIFRYRILNGKYIRLTCYTNIYISKYVNRCYRHCPDRRCGVYLSWIARCSRGGWTAVANTWRIRPELRDATWRDRSSMRWSNSVLSGDGATDAMVGWGVTSQMRSARCESASKPTSDWPASMAWMWGGRRLDQMLRRKLSGTSGARLFRCRRNWDGLRSPISWCMRNCRTRWSLDTDNRLTSSAFSVVYWSRSGGEVIQLRNDVAVFCSLAGNAG
jgi:hypothetical protein